MKFGVGNALKQLDPALDRNTAIVGAPQKQRFDTELIQLIVEWSLTRSVAPLQLSLVVLAGAHLIALADQLFRYQLFIENRTQRQLPHILKAGFVFSKLLRVLFRQRLGI